METIPSLFLTIEQVLAWADEHRERTGSWPRRGSGGVLSNPSENWRDIDDALCVGRRGLPGGSSLARLLAEHRNTPDTPTGEPAARPRGPRWLYGLRARAVELRRRGLTFEEIGRELKVSKQRAHQLVRSADERVD